MRRPMLHEAYFVELLVIISFSTNNITGFLVYLHENLVAMNKLNQDIAYFLSFCIEQYKSVKGISGTEALNTFVTYGILDYLSEHFDILHTQSRQWLLEEIDELIKTRKGESI